MNAQIALSSSAWPWTPRQMAVIKATVARDTNSDEFSLFMEYARVKGLDPFSRQVIAIIFNKDDPAKRQMTIVTTQEGLRVMAERTADYRPEQAEPVFEYDDSLKGPTNPLGIVKATVTLWKFSHGSWHPVVASAYWDEYAPIKREAESYEWEDTGDTWPNGKKKMRKIAKGAIVEKLDDGGQWPKRPRTMIAKCARSAALRAGWSTTFSGAHDEAEFDRARVLDLTASEQVEEELQRRREALIHGGGKGLAYVDQDGVLAFVPLGKYFDVIMTDASNCSTSQELVDMRARNKAGLQDFWAHQKDDALALRKKLDEIARRLVDDGSEA